MTEPKKGRPSWKPASRLSVSGKREGYVQRWVDEEPANLQRKKADGWNPVNGTLGSHVKHEHPDLTGDGKPLGSTVKYRNMVLMEIPEEDYKAHREYYAEQTRLQTVGLKARAEHENAANARGRAAAQLYGKITIE